MSRIILVLVFVTAFLAVSFDSGDTIFSQLCASRWWYLFLCSVGLTRDPQDSSLTLLDKGFIGEIIQSKP